MTARYFQLEFAVDAGLTPCITDAECESLLMEGTTLLYKDMFPPAEEEDWYENNRDTQW